MKISAEEKIMYEVMKALYDSGIPINFKGSMVLKACLMEAGFSDDTRHTVDIDGNWCSDFTPSGEQIVESLKKALNQNDIPLDVDIYRMYGKGKSAGFELKNKSSGEVLFTIDLDVNRSEVPTKVYEVEGVRFRGVSPKQMVADKVFVISTDKVFRRIKDVIDMYYISQVFEFDTEEVLRLLESSGRELGDFDGFINRIDDLRHSYEKFRFTGDENKPSFDEVYDNVRSFIGGLMPQE